MIPERITSRKNPLLQQVRRLTGSRRDRLADRLFLGDGTKLLQEAVCWCDGLECVILADTLPIPALPEQVAVYQVPEDVMQTISPMRTPQGAVFLCRMPEPQPMCLRPGTLILDGIQDPGNLGTILRTADALDTPVILTGACADPYNWKTVRASMGAIFRRTPMQATQEEIVLACRQQHVPLAVTALSERAMDIRQADAGECAVVIGSEGQGVSPYLLASSQQEWIIPMNPHCESLNAATAAAIVMWQMKSQR